MTEGFFAVFVARLFSPLGGAVAACVAALGPWKWLIVLGALVGTAVGEAALALGSAGREPGAMPVVAAFAAFLVWATLGHYLIRSILGARG